VTDSPQLDVLYLASSSPRRRELLRSIGHEPRLVRVDVSEALLPEEDPFDAAERLARAKATAARSLVPEDALVVAADTLVILEGEALGKPLDRKDAVRMLRALSGKRHDVVTGVALQKGGRLVSGRELTSVDFAELSETDIGLYVATGECDDKAGAYALQGRGGLFVTGLEGSPSNVVGLPVRLVAMLARKLDVSL
jgi:septum formation protein